MTQRFRPPQALLFGALLVFGTAGCGGDEGAAGGGGGGFSMPPTPVEVAPAIRAELVDRFDAVGTFEAVNAIEVVSEISGIVRDLPLAEGEHVAKGTLLARLEDSELAATLRRAEALLEQSRSRHQRIKQVVDQRAGAPQDLDDALADLRVAEAEVALARTRLDKTRIRASFDGYLGPRLVSPGSFVQAGQPLTQLTDLNPLKVSFTAPERYLPRLIVGAGVTVSTPAYPGLESDGKIVVVDPIVDPRTRTVEVIGSVANPNLRFRPGMSTDVKAILSRKSDALTIPSAAVFADGNQTLVFVVGPDSTVSRVPVVLGTRLSARVEVLEGLSEGDRVVQAGHQKLFPGAKVMPIPARGASTSPPDSAPPESAPQASETEDASEKGTDG